MDLYVKKYWAEENILYYIHFRNNYAVRQIEMLPNGSKLKLSEQNPIEGDHFLYDQELSQLDLDTSDFISEKEFDLLWYNYD